MLEKEPSRYRAPEKSILEFKATHTNTDILTLYKYKYDYCIISSFITNSTSLIVNSTHAVVVKGLDNDMAFGDPLRLPHRSLFPTHWALLISFICKNTRHYMICNIISLTVNININTNI